MKKPVEICLAVLGNRKLGNRHMAFGRLAWWLTKNGTITMKRLEDDPAWDKVLVVGFDAQGEPLHLPSETENEILETLHDVVSQPLPADLAKNMVTEVLSSDLGGEPMSPRSLRDKVRVKMLGLMYADRRRAWSA